MGVSYEPIHNDMLATIMAKIDGMRSDVNEMKAIQMSLRGKMNIMMENDYGEDKDYSTSGYSWTSSWRTDERGHGYRRGVGNRGEDRIWSTVIGATMAMEGTEGVAESSTMRMFMSQGTMMNGLGKGKREERVPRIYEESRHRRNRDHERDKGYERPIEEEAPFRAKKGYSSRHGRGDTSQSFLTPRKTNTSHPIRSPNMSFELLPDFPPSKSLIKSSKRKIQCLNCEDVGHDVKEEIVYHGDEVQSKDERESIVTCEEEMHPNAHIGTSSEVETGKKCKLPEGFRTSSLDLKKETYVNREKEKKLESKSELKKPSKHEKMLESEVKRPRESVASERKSKHQKREKNTKEGRNE